MDTIHIEVAHPSMGTEIIRGEIYIFYPSRDYAIWKANLLKPFQFLICGFDGGVSEM